MIERLRALEKAVELVAMATPGPWEALTPCEPNDYVTDIRSDDDGQLVAAVFTEHDGRLVAAAVNFIREHGSALIAELGQEVGAVADGLEFFAVPNDLHPETVNLVSRFAAALAEKLAISQRKYGYSNGWASPGWMDECREKLAEHIAKGDPRDVAAYCAFLWHHGESTCSPNASNRRLVEAVRLLLDSAPKNMCPRNAKEREAYKMLRSLMKETT